MARRKLIWARMAPAITSLGRVAGGVGQTVETQDLLQTYRTLAGITRGPVGLTVMRVRLQVTYVAVGTNGVAADYLVHGMYFGIRVEDFNSALLQETTEVPDLGPQLDPHADWMAWGRVQPVATYPTDNIVATADVDVRSMRKIDELGQTLVLAMQTTVSSASQATINCSATTSVLLALP